MKTIGKMAVVTMAMVCALALAEVCRAATGERVPAGKGGWTVKTADGLAVTFDKDAAIIGVAVDGRDLPLRGKGRTYGVKVAPMGKDWHTLRVEARGSVFTVFLDDRQLFQAEDATISNAGKMGLWTKADAVTLFDDFEVETADVP